MNVFETAEKYCYQYGLPLEWTTRDRFRFRGSVRSWLNYLRPYDTAPDTPGAFMLWPVQREGWEEHGFRGLASRHEVIDTFLRDDI
jgi:hypothetical protein